MCVRIRYIVIVMKVLLVSLFLMATCATSTADLIPTNDVTLFEKIKGAMVPLSLAYGQSVIVLLLGMWLSERGGGFGQHFMLAALIYWLVMGLKIFYTHFY